MLKCKKWTMDNARLQILQRPWHSTISIYLCNSTRQSIQNLKMIMQKRCLACISSKSRAETVAMDIQWRRTIVDNWENWNRERCAIEFKVTLDSVCGQGTWKLPIHLPQSFKCWNCWCVTPNPPSNWIFKRDKS